MYVANAPLEYVCLELAGVLDLKQKHIIIQENQWTLTCKCHEIEGFQLQ